MDSYAFWAEVAEDTPFADWALYCPQWRDRLPNGALGPFYGPKSLAEYARLQQLHRTSYHGGGLWDVNDPGALTERQTLKKVVEEARRKDIDDVEYYVNKHAGLLPMRELEVFYLYWRDRKTLGVVARELEISRDHVRAYIGRLRKRVREAKKNGRGAGKQTPPDNATPAPRSFP